MFLLFSFQVTKDLQRSSTPQKNPKQSVCLASLFFGLRCNRSQLTLYKSSCKTSPFFPTQGAQPVGPAACHGWHFSAVFFFRRFEAANSSRPLKWFARPWSQLAMPGEPSVPSRDFFFVFFSPGFCRLQKSSFFKKQIILLQKKHDKNSKI